MFADLLTLPVSINTNMSKAVLNTHRLYASCINETGIADNKDVDVLMSFITTELGGWPILQGLTWNNATFNFSKLLLKLGEYNSDVFYMAGTQIDDMNSSIQAIRVRFSVNLNE